MTAVVKHVTRKPLEATNATAEQAQARNSYLRARFPARAEELWWPYTAQPLEETLRRLTAPPFDSAANGTRAGRRRGVAKLLRWLSSLPGDTWQQRWRASGAEDLPGAAWVDLPLRWLRERGHSPSHDRDDLSSGLLMLICGDVIRPGLPWMLTRTHRYLASVMAKVRDPDGFARLHHLAESGPASSRKDAQIAATRIATLLACKGGQIRDIAVGDCVELVDAQRRVHARGGQKKVDFYLRLRALGIFPEDSPATIRAFGLALGQLSIEELVDRYRIQCRPVRDLIVDYLRERQPALDFASLDAVSRTLAGLFWARVEALAPGIDSLRLPPTVARAWKEDLKVKKRTVTGPDGSSIEVSSPRLNAKDELMRVRAFYLDIAQWAAEEPGRWAPWAVPCPISDDEIRKAKERRRRKARMDQRTRERLPVLPVLTSTADRRRRAAADLLQVARNTEPGALIPGTDGSLRRAIAPTAAGHLTWAEETASGGRRRNLTYEEEEAFWAFATIEVLRLTGIRNEELLELTHHSVTQYRLPSTGEVVPLLQIAPSKTDTERLLLVSPELADVLSAIISRLRGPDGAIPLVASYDVREKVWNPPMPLLFQRDVGSEHRAFTPTAIRKLLINALSTTGLTSADGEALTFSPHDFRRIFVTDAIMNGLPPHIAQVICGHRSIETTMGYKAVYPAETIEAHRAFIACRRASRPGEEYRTPTAEEWDSFLAHFEKRKVSIGTCARAFGSPCVHEHACVRCSLLRPDTAQRARLADIRDNLIARIAEAELEGWLGEVEGLQVSLAGAQDKLAQLDAEVTRRSNTVSLGMPALGQIALGRRETKESSPTAD
ncbi:site-specific integrase [Streptomyces sp. NBC_00984]|uniref:tyrosine-type recombinase/integrase n=1 Tax=Streptomyces sp. NBC_00984 TaxID=2903700 RepID=UPI00386809F3|nr:site-specific integrase [Streptomyces sp. NBC_00984]WSX26476.1 site-specific integrase [Streptomyces sp. NBC_00984]